MGLCLSRTSTCRAKKMYRLKRHCQSNILSSLGHMRSCLHEVKALVAVILRPPPTVDPPAKDHLYDPPLFRALPRQRQLWSLPMSRHVSRHTFRCPPPPLRVMVARPAQATQVTQVPNPLLHEPLHGVPCHRPPPPPCDLESKSQRGRSSCDLESKSQRGRFQQNTTQHSTAQHNTTQRRPRVTRHTLCGGTVARRGPRPPPPLRGWVSSYKPHLKKISI